MRVSPYILHCKRENCFFNKHEFNYDGNLNYCASMQICSELIYNINTHARSLLLALCTNDALNKMFNIFHYDLKQYYTPPPHTPHAKPTPSTPHSPHHTSL